MAKNKTSTKLKIRKGKKRWFPVISPKALGGAEIAQITAYDPSDLLNRNLLIPMGLWSMLLVPLSQKKIGT